MPKVFGLHEIEVPPGVTPEEHEQFLTKVLASAPVLPAGKPISSKASGASEPESFYCSTKSRLWRRAIVTSPGRKRCRRSGDSLWNKIQKLPHGREFTPNLTTGLTTSSLLTSSLNQEAQNRKARHIGLTSR